MRIRLLAAGVATVGLLAACGSSEAPSPSTGPSQPTSTDQHGGYAACLAEHGVTTPPMGPGAPPGVDAETWAKASEECADKAPGPSA